LGKTYIDPCNNLLITTVAAVYKKAINLHINACKKET